MIGALYLLVGSSFAFLHGRISSAKRDIRALTQAFSDGSVEDVQNFATKVDLQNIKVDFTREIEGLRRDLRLGQRDLRADIAELIAYREPIKSEEVRKKRQRLEEDE